MEKRNTKAEVLEILLNSGETPVSGERLAENLGISRNAVWKAVTALKEDGYNISAKRNSGYILNKSNVLSVIEMKKHLNNPKIADSIEIHRLVSSTNNVAKEYALNDKTTDVRIFISEEQSGGKGRQGRRFLFTTGIRHIYKLPVSPSDKGCRRRTAYNCHIGCGIEGYRKIHWAGTSDKMGK